jgi:tetratricopeptide (TPR) repeat protein
MVPPSETRPPGTPLDRDEAAAKPGSIVVLERDVSLSQSLIWTRQREFYLHRGLKAWTEDLVPAYITNNPYITEIYVRIVFAFLRDCIELSRQGARPISPANPLRILELGAGSGKFSFLFLRELTALLRAHGIAPASVRCCMTDCGESVLDEWRKNNYLAEFVAGGILVFELFRTGETIQSPFLAGQLPGSREPARGPLVVVANYVFDSLPTDAFIIQQEQISESLMTTSAPGQAEGKTAPEDSAVAGAPVASRDALARMKFSFTNAAVPPQRYADQVWSRILDDYRSRLSSPGATVLFPCGALAALQEIARFSDGRMLVLAADKGYAHEDALLLSQGPPAFEFHAANCFSQMVNFDAIGKYFEAVGGQILRPDKHAANFSICGFLARPAGEQFPATESAYRETQKAFGPDDLFTLLAWLNAHMEEMSVPQILAALRLTRWDTTALMRLFPVLSRQLRNVVAERYDLRQATLRTWANHYPVSQGDNVIAFYCGVILLELRFFDEAAVMFRASQKLFGPSAATSFNLGLCAQGLGRHEEALAAMKEACRLDPSFHPAQDALRKLEKDQPSKS